MSNKYEDCSNSLATLYDIRCGIRDDHFYYYAEYDSDLYYSREQYRLSKEMTDKLFSIISYDNIVNYLKNDGEIESLLYKNKIEYEYYSSHC